MTDDQLWFKKSFNPSDGRDLWRSRQYHYKWNTGENSAGSDNERIIIDKIVDDYRALSGLLARIEHFSFSIEFIFLPTGNRSWVFLSRKHMKR